MNLLNKLKSFVVLLFVCAFLVGTALTSCNQKSEAGEESTEHPAGEEEHPAAEKSEHPAGETEHPKSDTTKVEEQQ